MKKKYKVENSPRFSNAIKRVISDLHEIWSFWYNDSTSDAFGDKVFDIAYEADKFDVINGIHKGYSHGIISYSRGDIRYKRTLSQYAPFMLLLFVLITCFSIILGPPC